MTVLLGIDIGTSSTKALVCDTSGSVIATASSPHISLASNPGWSEQDPEGWWLAACAAVRDALDRSERDAAEVAGVGLSGQMHGSVLLGSDSLGTGGSGARALRPAILWNDQRTVDQCDLIERAAGSRAAVVDMVGNAPLTGFTLPKLLWVRAHEPDVWKSTAGWCLPKDFIRLRLTGEFATDAGDAAGTLLLDVDERAWSRRACELFDIDDALLPPVLESCAVAGRVTPWAAEKTGLAAGTPVVAGSGDNQCGAAGAGVVRPGLVLATLGTSGVIYAHSETPAKDTAGAQPGRVHTMCAATGTSGAPGQWSLTGCMLSAAGCLQWLHDSLFPEVPYEQLLAEAESAPAGAGGLIFLPHLSGERCPHPAPLARGAFVGLTGKHGRAHLVRAVVEGVTLTMRQILGIFDDVGVTADRVRLGGGGAKTAFWRQLQTDAYGLPTELPNTEEGPALGAALMAGVGSGLWPSLAEACDATIRVAETREPGEHRERYAELAAIHEPVFASLAPTFEPLGALETTPA